MPRSFLVKSKRAHSYHQPRWPDDECATLDTILAQVCAGGSKCAQLRELLKKILSEKMIKKNIKDAFVVSAGSRTQGEFESKLETEENMSSGADRDSPGSSRRSRGSLSSSSPLSSDCDFWRPPSPSSSPGLAPNCFHLGESLLKLINFR